MVNLGNPINSLGYYGSNVYLGNEKIVGNWRLYKDHIPWTDYTFLEDGTGTESGLQFSYGHDVNYGVDANGTQLLISVDSETMVPGKIMECQQIVDGCCQFEDNITNEVSSFCKL